MITLATGKNHSLFLISGCQSHHTCGLWMTLVCRVMKEEQKVLWGSGNPHPQVTTRPVLLAVPSCLCFSETSLASGVSFPSPGVSPESHHWEHSLYSTSALRKVCPKFTWSEAALTSSERKDCTACMKQLADTVKFSLLCLIFTLINK